MTPQENMGPMSYPPKKTSASVLRGWRSPVHGNGLFVLAAEDLLALRDYTIVEVDPFIEGRTVVLRLQAPELPDIELHVEGGYWKVLFDGG